MLYNYYLISAGLLQWATTSISEVQLSVVPLQLALSWLSEHWLGY